MSYEIQFVSSAKDQLNGFETTERKVIVAAIEEQLLNEPQIETRNRKRLRPNPLAPWELRVGNVRVFYDVEEPAKVTILAIGTKNRNKLYIGGKEIQLRKQSSFEKHPSPLPTILPSWIQGPLSLLQMRSLLQHWFRLEGWIASLWL